MESNPIVQICADYLAAGKPIREVRPGNRLGLKKEVMVIFRDGRQTPHDIDTQDRDQLLKWSTEATVYLREQTA
jgi:hypothetical protein